MKFLAHLQEMAEADVRALIPEDTLLRIKKTDPTPLFRAYIVGHEGESEGNLVGIGKMIKSWTLSAIHKLAQTIQYGTKIFHLHADDNRHEGRTQIGEVVAKATQYISGKLSALAVVYMFPQFRNLPLDVASIEADISIDFESNDSVKAVDVKTLTGIVLGNSANQTPGFANATLQAEIQAFVDRSQIQFQKGNEMTIDEIKAFIKANNVEPSDMFTLEQLTVDPSVAGYVKLKLKEDNVNEFEARKRIEAENIKSQTKTDKEKEDLEKEIAKLKIENAKTKTSGLFEKMKTDRKLSEKQVKYIEPKLAKFEPEKVEDMEKELEKHVDDLVDEFKVISKDVFGEETDETTDDEDKDKKPGGESDDKTKDKTGVDKYIDPESNPAIPTD